MQTKNTIQKNLAESIISDTIIFYRTMQGIQMSAHAANPGDTILLDSEMNYNGLNNALISLDLNKDHSAIPELINKFYSIAEVNKTTQASKLSQLVLEQWNLILITYNA